jgi:hypothetical protein
MPKTVLPHDARDTFPTQHKGARAKPREGENMPHSILPINTMQIEQGKLEEFKESVKNSLVFVA